MLKNETISFFKDLISGPYSLGLPGSNTNRSFYRFALRIKRG